MKKYKVLIEGGNCLLHAQKSPQKYGFFTTRFIEAQDSSNAEKIAIDLIRGELLEKVLNDPSDPPLLSLSEIREVESFDNHLVPGTGFTWYPEPEKH